MILSPDKLVREFVDSVTSSDPPLSDLLIEHELLRAPHQPHGLPAGKCAVYVFSLCESSGKNCPVGPNRVLKVGIVGPNSNARFLSQHYNPNSSGSNLAKSILNQPDQWRFLGISRIDPANVGEWIKTNTDRDHFYVSAAQKGLLTKLEKFVRGRLGGSVYEG